MNSAAAGMTLWTQYERALVAYVESTAEETGLMAAFELGRTTLADGHTCLSCWRLITRCWAR
jgi:hypothetical protein